jgi:hypothetical protein
MPPEEVRTVQLTPNTGMNDQATMIALAKQYLLECEGAHEVRINSATLKMLLTTFLDTWKTQQVTTSAAYPKVAK